MLRTIAAGTAGGLLGALAVWAFAGSALEKQLTSGATDLAAGLDVGRTELTQRLAEGRQQLRTQIRTEVQAQVPPVVRRELETTLRRYNITPDTGRQISSTLALVERLGLI